MQVGFIGLGIMGTSMAANLQKAGYQLVVHDIREASATPHLKADAKWADSPKVLAARHRAGTRAGRANAACQYGIRRDDGGAQPGLGETRQPITRAAPTRAVWP